MRSRSSLRRATGVVRLSKLCRRLEALAWMTMLSKKRLRSLLRRGIVSWMIYMYQQVLSTRHQITDNSSNHQKDPGQGLCASHQTRTHQ
jgi:hypothetical protein